MNNIPLEHIIAYAGALLVALAVLGPWIQKRDD